MSPLGPHEFPVSLPIPQHPKLLQTAIYSEGLDGPEILARPLKST